MLRHLMKYEDFWSEILGKIASEGMGGHTLLKMR
jgi:hypothetical protein